MFKEVPIPVNFRHIRKDSHGLAVGSGKFALNTFGTFRQRYVIAGAGHDDLAGSQFHDTADVATQAKVFGVPIQNNLVRPTIDGCDLLQDLKGPIRRAIIREDDLQWGIGLGQGSRYRFPNKAFSGCKRKRKR